MIREDTLLILGAGASAPYGYPTAFGLRHFIIKKFKNYYLSYCKKDLNLTHEEAKEATSEFDFIIQSFKESETLSFDLFLSRNWKFYEIGKHIIAWCILWFEKMSSFNEDMNNREQD